jgi:hypothetical protein
MFVRKNLEALITDDEFTMKTALNIFTFLVALGEERDGKIQERAYNWLTIHVANFSFSSEFVPPLTALFMEEFPESKVGDADELKKMLTILNSARSGAIRWWNEYERFGQLAAVIDMYSCILKNKAAAHSRAA